LPPVTHSGGSNDLSRVYVTCPGGDEAKPLLTFYRKFTVPFRQALKKYNNLAKKENLKTRRTYVCFMDYETAYVGYSIPNHRSEEHMGIMRLRFSNESPSRSSIPDIFNKRRAASSFWFTRS